MKRYIFLFFLAILTFSYSYAQVVNQTSFEREDDDWNQHVFDRQDWRDEGFDTKWVNGFDQGRAIIDHSFAHSGDYSLRLMYPKNQYGSRGTGGQAYLEVPPRDEYFVSYALRFSEDFDWGGRHEGGKLPGLASGENCSGCKTCTGDNGFTARLMWRPAGRAVLYLYHMDKGGACGEDYPLMDEQEEQVRFNKGEWYVITERVKINSANKKDGEVEVWVNGHQAILLTGIRFVNNNDKVDNFYFSTFHGGGDQDWAPGNDSYMWFDDIVIGETLEDVLAPNDPTSDPPVPQPKEMTIKNVWLEGFYDPNLGTMSQKLNSEGLLPLQQPFSSPPWNYKGNESLESIPAFMADWVLLRMRNSLGTVLEEKACIMTARGDIQSVKGDTNISFTSLADESQESGQSSYIISIHPRGHLAVAFSLSSGLLIDPLNSSITLGNDQLKKMGEHVVMYSGDFDHNGIINNLDFNLWQLNGAAINQYLPADADGNGIINNLDYNLWTNNRSKIGSNFIK